MKKREVEEKKKPRRGFFFFVSFLLQLCCNDVACVVVYGFEMLKPGVSNALTATELELTLLLPMLHVTTQR